MDNLTDLLTNIFVSGKTHKPTQSKPKPETVVEESKVETKLESKVDSKSESKDESKAASEPQSKEKVSEPEDSTSQESKSEKSDSSSSSSSSSDSSTSDSESSESSESSNESESSKDSDSESSESKIESKIESVKMSEKKEELVAKTVLKASDFYKKNLMIVNHEAKKNLEILSELLYKLSKMTSVNDIYENSLHIFTFSENKKNFREMLLENPYLYFNDFVIKTNLSNLKFESSKRHIVVVDFDVISDIEKLSNLMKDNIQLIVLHNTYNHSVLDVYKLFGKNGILIHKKDRLKLLQKRFYAKIIKHLTTLNEQTYVDVINDENLDVKLVIMRNGELRYS